MKLEPAPKNFQVLPVTEDFKIEKLEASSMQQLEDDPKESQYPIVTEAKLNDGNDVSKQVMVNDYASRQVSRFFARL